MALVLLISSDEMKNHKHQLIFKDLFINHMNSELTEVLSFLKSKNLTLNTEIGKDENDKTILAISLESKNIIGFKEN